MYTKDELSAVVISSTLGATFRRGKTIKKSLGGAIVASIDYHRRYWSLLNTIRGYLCEFMVSKSSGSPRRGLEAVVLSTT